MQYVLVLLLCLSNVAWARHAGAYPIANNPSMVDLLCDNAGRYAANAARLRNGGFNYKYYLIDFDVNSELIPGIGVQRPLAVKVGKIVYSQERTSASSARRIVRDMCYENPHEFE